MMAQTMTEQLLTSFASVLALMTSDELEFVFRFIAKEIQPHQLDDINCAMRRVCIEQENLRLVTQ